MKARLVVMLPSSLTRNVDSADPLTSWPSRSWPACERLSVAPRSAVETALVVEEGLVTDVRPCHLSSLPISFTKQTSGLSQRSAPLPCEMTLQLSCVFLSQH